MEGGANHARDQERARLENPAEPGQPTASEATPGLHERRVLLTALRLLNRNLEDAKDAAQQVFLRLHRSLGRLDENRHFASWLYRITVNVCRDMLRARGHRPTVSLEEAGGGLVAAPDDPVRNEQRRQIYAALATLPERERTAVVLRDLEGFTTSEAARIMGCSEVTVRSQISNARVKIRKFVQRRPRRPL